MGEAKKRASELATWLNTLSLDERVIFDVSRVAYDRIIKPLQATGVCYRMSFFLTAYLKQEHQVPVVPVVGYVNDGESDIMTSHAWVEFGGKKTDLSLTLTEHPDAQLPGPLLILDRHLTRSRTVYTYHRERGPAGSRAVEELMSYPQYRELARHKEAEHVRMTEIAKDPGMILLYLNAAPDGMGYEVWARRIRSA